MIHLSVLVVGDSPDALISVATLLSMYGYQVTSAETGGQVIEVLTQTPCQVVVLKLSLRGLSGFELARRIRDLNQKPKPFIIAIANQGEVEKARSIDVAIDRFLFTPINPKELLDLLTEIERT